MSTFIHKAVPRFNEIHPSSPTLRYTWPLFLKDREGTSKFWSRLKRWILSRLKTTSAVLECRRKKELSRPEDLLYIPPEFRLNGKPLIEDKSTEKHHLSFSYDSEISQILPELSKIGVETMSFKKFYKELRDCIFYHGVGFLEEQSNEWHSKVAQLLIQKGTWHQQRAIRLIPLHDGRWVDASEDNIFLEEDISRATIPRGLNFNLVDLEACRDGNRRAFFREIGIRNCDQAAICRLIMQRYRPFDRISLSQSIDDLIYLFRTPQSVYNGPFERLQLLPAPPLEGFRYAKRFYIQDEKNICPIISQYAQDPASKIPLLHPLYLDAIRGLGKESQFLEWACSCLKMSTRPHLVDEAGKLTPELKFLGENASMDLMLLLRNNWSAYKDQLKHDNLVTEISKMSVSCTDKIARPLRETILPRRDLQPEGPDLPQVAVPEPDDSRWIQFSSFGVLTSLNSKFYLRQLIALASRPDSNGASKSSVQSVYTRLESQMLLTEPTQ